MTSPVKQSLILIRGLPGSGKSTLARALKNSYGGTSLFWYEADMFFMNPHTGVYEFYASRIKEAHEWCQNRVRMILESGDSVIVSNTFIRLWEMNPYMEMIRKRDNISLQILECKGNFGSIHGVPEEKILQMKANWEEYKV